MMLCSIVFCCLLGEVALRILNPVSKEPWHDRPNFYYVPQGSENLQGNSYQKQKPENVFRIAVVGDSFTFAPFMQYDDSFTQRLERMLNLKSSNRKVEVINYGVPGFSSAHEVPLVRQALNEGADLVMLEITLNDPERKPYQPEGITIKQNEQGAIVVETAKGQSWLARHSKLYSFLFGRVSVYKQGKSYEEYFHDLFRDKLAMGEFEGAIKKMKDASNEKKVPLVAVIFPLFGSKLDDNYPFKDAHEKIGSLLNGISVPFVDLEPIYRGIPAERLQVMPGEDFHPNEIGHRMAAEGIFCWLSKANLVPEEFLPDTLWKQRAQLKFPMSKNNTPLTVQCP